MASQCLPWLRCRVRVEGAEQSETLRAREEPEGQTRSGPRVLVVRPADPEAYPPGGAEDLRSLL